MKKILTVCMAMVMVFALSVTALAAPASFVKSPTSSKAPDVEDVTNEKNEKTEITITAYGDRDELKEDVRTEFEQAYTEIANSKDLSELNDDLKKIAEDKNIPAENLAVSDLFSVDKKNTDDTGAYSIKLDVESAEKFVGLMYLTDEGWKMVLGATIDKEGFLNFKLDTFPVTLAMVVDAGAPATGDTFNFVPYVIVMAVAAVALVVVLAVSRKKKEM